MRPHAKQMPLFNPNDMPAIDASKLWRVGQYVPSGKLKPIFYLYDRSGRRALDIKGRRRKFSTWNAARKAGDELERTPRAR